MQTHTNMAVQKLALPSPEFVERIDQWTSFPLKLVHKVLTSVPITQVYRQNLSH